MKVKLDHVTNSSSASFYLFITTQDTNLDDLDDFIERMERLTSNISYKEMSFHKDDITQVSQHVFKLEGHTSMYNNCEDMPLWFRSILLEWYIHKSTLFDAGIEDIYFESKMNGY